MYIVNPINSIEVKIMNLNEALETLKNAGYIVESVNTPALVENLSEVCRFATVSAGLASQKFGGIPSIPSLNEVKEKL